MTDLAEREIIHTSWGNYTKLIQFFLSNGIRAKITVALIENARLFNVSAFFRQCEGVQAQPTAKFRHCIGYMTKMLNEITLKKALTSRQHTVVLWTPKLTVWDTKREYGRCNSQPYRVLARCRPTLRSAATTHVRSKTYPLMSSAFSTLAPSPYSSHAWTD